MILYFNKNTDKHRIKNIIDIRRVTCIKRSEGSKAASSGNLLFLWYVIAML